ncbi:MAG: hypothetical protein II240_01115 [Bacteroidaceae bacterium]|nr:hypothetical protein [Bacteroidaceae bacterium]
MVVEKVGRPQWNALKVGEIGIFTLPTQKAKACAIVAKSDVARLEGKEFERVETNEPLTVAYKRVK